MKWEKNPNQRLSELLTAGRAFQIGSQIPLLEGQVHTGKTQQDGTAMDPHNVYQIIFPSDLKDKAYLDLKVVRHGGSSLGLMNKREMIT